MDDSDVIKSGPLETMLRRSDDLHEALLNQLDGTDFDLSPRGRSAFGMCSVSLEHAIGLRVLVAAECPTPVVGLMRMQFEALTRAMWLLYAASDSAIAKLTPRLSTEAEHAANNLPSASAMVDAIDKRVGADVPIVAHAMLERFKDTSWRAMNSYVHAGIHPLRRYEQGYPLPFILQIVGNSNALSTMAGMTLALLTADANIIQRMSQIQRDFADCLPDLLEQK